MGAIVAAQEGIPVGSIQGVKRYTAAGGHAPLPELAGVDFGGRGFIYVPDADVKPEAIADVEKHAPKACEWLISRQNGIPRIATVPTMTPAIGRACPKDLDEWILAAPEAGYYGILSTLYSRSAAPEEWRGIDHAEDGEEGEDEIAPEAASDEGSGNSEPSNERPPPQRPADSNTRDDDVENGGDWSGNWTGADKTDEEDEDKEGEGGSSEEESRKRGLLGRPLRIT